MSNVSRNEMLVGVDIGTKGSGNNAEVKVIN